MPNGAGLDGKLAMVRKLRNVARRFPDHTAAGLYIEFEVEVKEVKRRTPVDRGPLRTSEHQVGPIRQGRKIYSLIVAGGPAAPYAIYVHEDPDAFHGVGQWKYLESVIIESRPHMGARVAKRIAFNRSLLGE